MTTLSDRISAARKHAGFHNMETAAAACGIARSTYAMYEKGDRSPKEAPLQKIADTFAVSRDWLLTGGIILNSAEGRDLLSATLEAVQFVKKTDPDLDDSPDRIATILVTACDTIEDVPTGSALADRVVQLLRINP